MIAYSQNVIFLLHYVLGADAATPTSQLRACHIESGELPSIPIGSSIWYTLSIINACAYVPTHRK